jgi:hypothetical protein
VVRALRSAAGDEPELRRDLRAHAEQRMAAAMSAGYFIEAVALQDSMISDRLENLLGLHHEHVAMNSTGQLAHLSRTLNPDAFDELAERVRHWAEHRNVVVHQMVKVGPTHADTWAQRMAEAQRTAQAGLALLAEVDRAVAEYENSLRCD